MDDDCYSDVWNANRTLKANLATLGEEVFALRAEVAALTERIASLEAAAPTQSLYAWYMGEGDVLIVAAPSIEAARVAGRAKIREIYLETMWERTYQILAGECVRMEPGSAIYVDHEDISWAEHAEFLAARYNREGV